MKTTTMLIIGVAAVGAYYAYTSSQTQNATVFGLGGSQTIQVDGNMSAAEIATMQTNWNGAVTTMNQSAAQAVIAQLQGANHPKAAAALQAILLQAQQQFGGSTQGYSAGRLALHPIMGIHQVRGIHAIDHPIVHIHRLAMIGRI